jgi:hypothetical protein
MEEIMEEIILLVLGAVLMLQIDLPKEVDKDRRNDVRISVIEDLEAADGIGINPTNVFSGFAMLVQGCMTGLCMQYAPSHTWRISTLHSQDLSLVVQKRLR